MVRTRAMAVASLLTWAADPTVALAQPCEPGWSDQFPTGDINGAVNAAILHDDGTGAAIYIGGAFTRVGGIQAPGVARWNGTAWSAVGPGFNGEVNALYAYDNGSGMALYAGGAFTSVGGAPAIFVAKWNGTSWSAVGPTSGPGSLIGGSVNALFAFNDGFSGLQLFAGGELLRPTGSTSFGIVRLGAQGWSTTSTSPFGFRTFSFATHTLPGQSTKLYAGGQGTFSNVIRWEGNGWTDVAQGSAGGPNGTVRSLVSFDDGSGSNLYAAGDFRYLGSNQPVGRIARWNGGLWSALPADFNGSVRAMSIVDIDGPGGLPPRLYAGGDFSIAGGQPVAGLGSWTGSAWLPAGSGLNDTVTALAPFAQSGIRKLFVGGAFSAAGGLPVSRAASFNGVAWAAFGNQQVGAAPSDAPRSFAWFDPDGKGPAPGKLYVAGDFRTIGSLVVNHIAAWDGGSWSTVGAGSDGTIRSLKVHTDGSGTALYAAGDFTTIGGVTASRVARFDGSTWSPLGAGLSNTVYSLESYAPNGQGAKLYAAGSFQPPSGGVATGIAVWDGVSWSTPGTGLNLSGGLSLLAFDDGAGLKLYLSGVNMIVSGLGGTPQAIIRWNGSTWSYVGSGLQFGASINAMAVHDDGAGPALYVAGQNVYTAGGGVYYNGAKWTGAWSPITSLSPSTDVQALASHDDGSGPALYAGGSFTTIGGTPAAHIARLRGSVWTPLGDGLLPQSPASVASLGSIDPDGPGPVPAALWVGGRFASAGTIPSGNLAVWTGCATACYANCDGSAAPPVLNINDFVCFQSKFAAGDPYANCDGSTAPPVLNINDFICFQARFAAGCP